MTWHDWALKYNLPPQAMVELNQLLSTPYTKVAETKDHSEDWVSSNILLESSMMGARLWRNNVGATTTENGFLRYGLCNETKAINEQLKSSDFIGVTPMVVQQHHIGRTLGIFTAIEAKKTDWQWKGKGREVPQANFINLGISVGGIGGFINDAGQFEGLVKSQLEI